jgi:signal transduction histidine kinase
MKNDYPHFRRLWYRVLVALMGSAFIPLVVIGGIFSLYSVSIFKSRTVEMLVRDVEMRQQHIDRFLKDRILELKWVARTPTALLTEQERFDEYTRDLTREFPWIHDLGVFDRNGKQLAYSGSYVRETRTYSDTPWFRKALDAGVCISDMALGYRQVPHVSIAVRRDRDHASLVIRASIDADTLQQQLEPGWKAFKKSDVFMIDRDGRYQTQSRTGKRLMAHSGLGIQEPFDGTRIHEADGEIVITAWLSEAPWVLVARFDADDVFSPALELRYLSIWALIIGGIIMVFFILLTANTLISRLEAKRQKIQHLNRQLRRSSFMTSTMELGISLLQEVTDRLGSITVASQWMQNHLAGVVTPQVDEDLKQIRESASSAQERLKQFLSSMRSDAPMITEVNLVGLMEELVSWLKKELTLRCIRVAWVVDKNVPEIRTDRSRLRHAIQNILLNAVSAVDKHGEIHIAVATEGQEVTVTITDSGPGIPEADREIIFEPLYTTKPDGTGLGLPVARDVLQALGGSLILVQPSDRGAAFRMVLPRKYLGPQTEDQAPHPTSTP